MKIIFASNLFMSCPLVGSYAMQHCKYNIFKNYEANGGFRSNVWKFRVIDYGEVLRKLIRF